MTPSTCACGLAPTTSNGAIETPCFFRKNLNRVVAGSMLMMTQQLRVDAVDVR